MPERRDRFDYAGFEPSPLATYIHLSIVQCPQGHVLYLVKGGIDHLF